MNFVIFGYNFPPMSNAEAFCSARFASALAQGGHTVHVVTMDHKWAIDPKIYDALVDKNIKITRIPLADKTKPKFFSRLRYRFRDRSACEVAICTKRLKKVLTETNNPILISRSLPEVSNIVAWHCRKYATKWIAHFSDPFPWSMGKWKSLSDYIFAKWEIGWGKRIIRDADSISVTCECAKKYFQEFYGPIFTSKETILTTHIGEPSLITTKEWHKDCKGTLVVHSGGLWVSRGARQVANALDELNVDGDNFDFCQVGEIEKEAEGCFANRPWAHIIGDANPDLATAVLGAADICFIPDMQTNLPYSPFLPSKFVYQLFTDVPIVVYSCKDSEMAHYAERFPEAGVVFADINTKDSLGKAFKQARLIKRGEMRRDRIRNAFTRKAIQELYAEL